MDTGKVSKRQSRRFNFQRATTWRSIRVKEQWLNNGMWVRKGREQNFKPFPNCCCSAYLSSFHRTASDANLLNDPLTFSLQRLLRDWRNPHQLKSFRGSNVPVDFFEFLSTEFAACSKPSSRDNYGKASYPKDATTWPGCGLSPDHSIRVVVKTTPLPIQPRCRQWMLYSTKKKKSKKQWGYFSSTEGASLQ